MSEASAAGRTWYCSNCEQFLTVGETAQVCGDGEDCPRSDEYDGSPCGYLVCTDCHHPARGERRRIQ